MTSTPGVVTNSTVTPSVVTNVTGGVTNVTPTMTTNTSFAVVDNPGTVTNVVVMEIPGSTTTREAPPDAQTDVSLPAGAYTIQVTGNGRSGTGNASVTQDQLTRVRISIDRDNGAGLTVR